MSTPATSFIIAHARPPATEDAGKYWLSVPAVTSVVWETDVYEQGS